MRLKSSRKLGQRQACDASVETARGVGAEGHAGTALAAGHRVRLACRQVEVEVHPPGELVGSDVKAPVTTGDEWIIECSLRTPKAQAAELTGTDAQMRNLEREACLTATGIQRQIADGKRRMIDAAHRQRQPLHADRRRFGRRCHSPRQARRECGGEDPPHAAQAPALRRGRHPWTGNGRRGRTRW